MVRTGVGVSIEEAEFRLVAGDELLPARAAIRELAGDRFAGSWLEHTPEFRAVLLVTGDEPLIGADAILASAPAPIAVLTGAKHTWADLRAGLDRLVPQVSNFPGAAAGMNVQANSVYFQTVDALGSESRSALAELAGVPVLFTTGSPNENHHTWGGRSLSPPGCTTGFASGTTIRGMLTAGHCGNASNRYHQNADINYPMTVFYEWDDEDEDWEWIKEPNSQPNPHPVEAKFWSGWNYRWVTNGSGPPLADLPGMPVCHFGRGSQDDSCGTVTDATATPGDICGQPFPGPCSAEFVRVEGPQIRCSGGDSGGPWYANNRAYGIHKGGVAPNGPCYYTPTQSINAHGFTIIVGP